MQPLFASFLSYSLCVWIKLFVLDFHPRILGLTGSHDQLHDVTKAFRVYHSPSPKDDDGDYLEYCAKNSS